MMALRSAMRPRMPPEAAHGGQVAGVANQDAISDFIESDQMLAQEQKDYVAGVFQQASITTMGELQDIGSFEPLEVRQRRIAEIRAR